ncbi:MAG: elongation factor P maturation arginine rhamnosyltransferase EarP [Pseudomonadota bacterium]
MTSLSTPKLHWDIFCKIVDNFGDIGICWRLAKQLRHEHGLIVRLWIDDLATAKKIIPHLNVGLKQQVIDEIVIFKLPNADEMSEADFTNVADVVIEAFACELPIVYLSAMAQKKSKYNQQITWINLEYLSAEPWVADFHAQPSPQANGLTRHFYFPGFTESTGSLIREVYIVNKNQILASSSDSQDAFWQSLNLTNSPHLKVSLFTYPHAPINDLLTAMAESNQPIDCYVPESSILSKVADFFAIKSLKVGENVQLKNLNLHVLPFLNQVDYDQLLTACDINFVRGEDSWLRAIWAGKPFIWQPYFQDESAHIKKLEAFLALFYANFDVKAQVIQMHTAWASEHLSAAVWQDYLNQLPNIAGYTSQQSLQLAKQTDLAAKLVIFCNRIQ